MRRVWDTAFSRRDPAGLESDGSAVGFGRRVIGCASWGRSGVSEASFRPTYRAPGPLLAGRSCAVAGAWAHVGASDAGPQMQLRAARFNACRLLRPTTLPLHEQDLTGDPPPASDETAQRSPGFGDRGGHADTFMERGTGLDLGARPGLAPAAGWSTGRAVEVRAEDGDTRSGSGRSDGLLAASVRR